MKKPEREIANVKIGKPDVKPTLPSHVPGVKQGNHAKGTTDVDGARRSTGVNVNDHEPIDPRMPKIPPA